MTTKANTHFSRNWPWVTPHSLMYCNFKKCFPNRTKEKSYYQL